ncbi:hypothetical protein Sjap_020674 [Stephania japonica]|uniref:Uncharacterized protein n=1 Tax=Stephania japonica TaxID=461633 RepID=A0AAP0F152_9MAGN
MYNSRHHPASLATFWDKAYISFIQFLIYHPISVKVRKKRHGFLLQNPPTFLQESKCVAIQIGCFITRTCTDVVPHFRSCEGSL